MLNLGKVINISRKMKSAWTSMYCFQIVSALKSFYSDFEVLDVDFLEFLESASHKSLPL